MGVLRVGPGRQAGEQIELAQQAANDLLGVSLAAELIELVHDARQRSLHVENRALGVVLALILKALSMFEEFFAIEIGQGGLNACTVRRRTTQ